MISDHYTDKHNKENKPQQAEQQRPKSAIVAEASSSSLWKTAQKSNTTTTAMMTMTTTTETMNSTTSISFRWPYATTTITAFSQDPHENFRRHLSAVFPPVIHWNAWKKTNTMKHGKAKNKMMLPGPRLLDHLRIEQQQQDGHFYANVEIHQNHQPSSYNMMMMPVLGEQTKIWNQKLAAKTAVRLQFPIHVVRFLGCITRHVELSQEPKPGSWSEDDDDDATAWYPNARKKITFKNDNEAKREGITDKSLLHLWNQTLEQDGESGKSKTVAPWNNVGECDYIANVDSEYVGVHALLQLLRKEINTGTDQNRVIIQEMIEILEHCQDLMNPNELWNIPLLFVYPVVKKIQHPVEHRSNKKAKLNAYRYEICMGIYCHRLLPEATTTSLGKIMNAMDKDSYIVSEPIHQPSQPSEPTFSSAPYPVVCYDDENKEEDWILREGDRDDSQISAFTTKGLLKLLENTGNDVSDYETRVQPLLRDFGCSILLHQQHAISWMLQMESLPGFGINSILWEEREFLDGGRYYYCPTLGQLRLEAPAKMWGGMLCDEMGLGKTVEILGLIVASLSDLKQEAQQTGGCHATLIIVPPALVAQWQAEITKATGKALTVEYWDARSDKDSLKMGNAPNGTGSADIVITTYNALDKTVIAKALHQTTWGRIVLDEMQEIRSSTSKIAKACENLKSRRRWMLSGTPLFEGIKDFLGEFNFLNLEPFAASNEDGFFDFMIAQPWENHAKEAIERLQVLSAVMLRRSKSMTIRATGAPIMGLPPLTVEFVPVHQTESERALYYFLESLVSQQLRLSGSCVDGNSPYTLGKKTKASRKLCLRLLRDMCNSSILLNGGLGASSQLMSIHRVLLQVARQASQEGSSVDDDGVNDNDSKIVFMDRNQPATMSCDEAILYLAQVQEATRTGEDEIAGMQLGFGGGVSKRTLAATESVSARLKEAEEQLKNLSPENHQQKSNRAKARWHLLMETITLGKLPIHCMTKVNRRFRLLWLWRFLVSGQVQERTANQPRWSWRSIVSDFKRIGIGKNNISRIHSCGKLPQFLQRGWRPTLTLIDVLRNKYDYHWTHSHSFELKHLPREVTECDIEEACAEILVQQKAHDTIDIAKRNLEVIILGPGKAGIKFKFGGDALIILDKATSNGISLASPGITDKWNECLAATESAFNDAKTFYSVHPTESNKEAFRAAKKKNDRVKRGLLITCASPESMDDDWDVVMSRAYVHPRTDTIEQPDTSLIWQCHEVVNMSSSLISTSAETIKQLEEKLVKYNQILQKNVSDDVKAMSAFEAIQALQKGDEAQLPDCSICLMTLGDTGKETLTTNISMTKCGHLFCRGCIQGIFAQSTWSNCPCCRKQLSMRDVVHIDPAKDDDHTERSKAAKSIVCEASKMLEQSNGQLTPSMWNALYHAIDTPTDVDDSRDIRVSSIPRHFMAHLRNTTGLPVHCNARETPCLCFDSKCLSSKVKALLRDLPRDQRSVVFSGSKMMIKHLECVLENLGIGCRALFSGQEVEDSRMAVTHWHEEKGSILPYPFLLVQAGAAASGLTLTAASKMFIMDPFLRYEEEQQAYARCHRYGQKYPVHCKCYFVPVSVESRLLEWRKRATGIKDGSSDNVTEASAGTPRTNFVYSTMSSGDEFDTHREKGDDEEERDHDQTEFLLGLHHDTSGPCTVETLSVENY